jgi:ADP-ribosyl-[dinitrogen reductase] hydrolase
MVVGDALGAPLEFKRPRAGGAPASITGMGVLAPGQNFHDAFRLRPGQWTDDASMGLCLMDSLLASCTPAPDAAAAAAAPPPPRAPRLDPRELMLRFVAWWEGGYNNAFRLDAERFSAASVGLGGTIGESLGAFQRDGLGATRTGDARSSGNGSVMRNAACGLAFSADERAAAACARAQSRTTHRGDEAAECAALMAVLTSRAARSPEADPAARKAAVLASLADFEPEAPCASVRCLARGEAELRRRGGGAVGKAAEAAEAEEWEVDPNRDWRWRSPAHAFSPERVAAQQGYVGSYSMDALAMALHCVHATDSFEAAVLLAANHCGDADSVAAVTGQIAGAIYGVEAIPHAWLAAVARWDAGGRIERKARCLFARAARARAHAEALGLAHVPPVLAATAEEPAAAPAHGITLELASGPASSKKARFQQDAQLLSLKAGGEAEAGFFKVQPRSHCVHAAAAGAVGAFALAALAAVDVGGGAPCRAASCGASGESWVCLLCGAVGCSSYQRGHARAHAEAAAPACCLAYSLADGSTWCYICEDYIDAFLVPALHAPVAAVYRRLHGEDPVFPAARAGAGAGAGEGNGEDAGARDV